MNLKKKMLMIHCLFNNETEADSFFNSLDKIHPSLKSTLDKETDYTLPFSNVFVRKTPLCYVTSIYHKSKFMDLYSQWILFASPNKKLMICSESTLAELKFISETHWNNGFPLSVVQTIITKKIAKFNKIKQASVQKCPVYLHLPWLSGIYERSAKKIT